MGAHQIGRTDDRPPFTQLSSYGLSADKSFEAAAVVAGLRELICVSTVSTVGALSQAA
jgi:hypothetical protein